MKTPQKPPLFLELLAEIKDKTVFARVIEMMRAQRVTRHYLHWDKLRRVRLPEGAKHRELWLATKLQRQGLLKPIPLKDKTGESFQFCVPELVLQYLHKIDVGAGGTLGVPEQITNPQTRDQYLISSLMQEAITSSQLEGAATTREVAKEMIRTGRKPRDTDEQMILNNYITMRHIAQLKDRPLSPEMVFEIHRLVTEKTLEDNSAAGRLRTPEEKRVVCDDSGEIYHDPPPAQELDDRLRAMCDFGNEKTPEYFIHPVVRAILLHFWLAYDHPFVDGNGRTARALFYWSMLRSSYWLFEFISISTILRKAPIKYARSFLYTETDENDLTYFIVAQTRVIDRAIKELHEYIDRKSSELRELETRVRALDLFNHRQVAVIRHALKHPYQHYSVESHRTSHNVAYETSRTDLLNLHSKGLLEQKKKGKKLMFSVPNDFAHRLRNMGKQINNGSEIE